MATEIEAVRTPEEAELKRKLEELGVLEADLAEKELALATLTVELEALESRYVHVVGRKFAELDRLHAEIAELMAESRPDDSSARSAAQAARERAEESARETGQVEDRGTADKFLPSAEIQELYRRLAKKVHPDLAFDEEDRQRRNSVMAEVNRAYAEGDIERLQAILEEWETSPEAIEGEDVGARLVRTIRMIARVKKRIAQIEKAIQELTRSDLHELKLRAEEAEKAGRDLIKDMAEKIDKEISEARDYIQSLRTQA